jgi:(R,R)-butanediol dehydrogenase / meso-butanediol dehydrogenase / diacetyl reductase
MNTMLAARYLEPHCVAPREVAVPDIEEEEALIEVEVCGICGSDINILDGTHPRAKAPLTIGHELSGRIVKIRSSSNHFDVGDRVTIFPLISCGKCHACTHGNSHVCRSLRLYGFDVDGGMAQFVKVPVASVLKLPVGMPACIGALIEPLAVAVHGIARANLTSVELAVVLGAGPIGLLAALVAQARGVPQVVISDLLPSRRDLARSLGLCVAEAGEHLRQQVMELSSENGADLLLECAGQPSSAREMTALVRSRGVIVNFSVFKKPVPVDMQAVNFKEIEILGSRVYERKDFQTAIDLAMQMPLEPIVSRVYPLREVRTAFEQLRSGEMCKILITPLEPSQ